jgi:hypothetical protein
MGEAGRGTKMGLWWWEREVLRRFYKTLKNELNIVFHIV